MMKGHTEKMPRLVAELHAQISPIDPVIRNSRITPDDRKLDDDDYVLANPPFNDSDTALRACAFLQSEATLRAVSEAKDNFRKDDDARWQWSGATWTTRQGCPEGERGGVHQFGVPPKGNANFAWVRHFIHHLAPQGMAGFVLANGGMSSNQSGDCRARSAVLKPKANPQSLPRQRDIRRALIEADLVDCMVALPGQLFYSTQKFSLN